jgi:CRP-like cAMP-binding protein
VRCGAGTDILPDGTGEQHRRLIPEGRKWGMGTDMLLKDEVQMLRRVPLFSNVEPGKLKLLAFTSDRVSYDSSTGPIKIAEVETNSIVGEIAILCDVSRTATVQTTTAVEALRIRKEHFLKLLTDFPEITIEIMRVLADRLSHTTSELSEARSRARKAE